MDCETTIIFTKDPQYIVNAHSWPDEITKKEKQEANKEKTNQRETTPNKRGFMDNLGKGVTDIFSKKPSANKEGYSNNDRETEQKSNFFCYINFFLNNHF